MPKKRKSKGKVQKKKKAIAAKEKKEHEESIEARVAKLNIASPSSFDEDALLEEAIKLAVAEKGEFRPWWRGCDHGFAPHDVRIWAYCNEFGVNFDAAAARTDDLPTSLSVATQATRKEFPDVANDPAKREMIASNLIAEATQIILDGHSYGRGRVRTYACVAYFHEQYIAVYLNKAQSSLNMRKIFELHHDICDERTLISFLQKRIPCSCLDAKYEAVKSMKKMGICCHFSYKGINCCSLPDGKIERSKMLKCSRCNRAYYCSRKCALEDWEEHKHDCLSFVEAKAKFDSEQQLFKD